MARIRRYPSAEERYVERRMLFSAPPARAGDGVEGYRR